MGRQTLALIRRFCYYSWSASGGVGAPLTRCLTTDRAVSMASISKAISRTDSRKAYLSKAGHANLADLLGQLTWLWNIALHRRKQA